MSSIDSGAIFPPRLGQDLSRNVVVVSVYALYKNPSWRIGSGMTPKNRDFRDFFDCIHESEVAIKFWRPCRGLSTWKGASPMELWFYMTRRAFLALRVIPVQGKSWSSLAANLLCAKTFGKLVIWRFLETHKFNFGSSAKQKYFRSRCVWWFIREVQENWFRVSIFASKCFP